MDTGRRAPRDPGDLRRGRPGAPTDSFPAARRARAERGRAERARKRTRLCPGRRDRRQSLFRPFPARCATSRPAPAEPRRGAPRHRRSRRPRRRARRPPRRRHRDPHRRTRSDPPRLRRTDESGRAISAGGCGDELGEYANRLRSAPNDPARLELSFQSRRDDKFDGRTDRDRPRPIADARAMECERAPGLILHRAEPGFVDEGLNDTGSGGLDPSQRRRALFAGCLRAFAQWTIFDNGSSKMSVAPRSLSSGMRTLISAFLTTVSTAKPPSPNSIETVGVFMAGKTAITESRCSVATLSLTSTFPLASSAPNNKVRIWPMAWALSGSAAEIGLAISSGYDSSTTSSTRNPAACRARPVSVISTTASAISGTFASVAPYEGRTSAVMPCSERKRLVRFGYSVATREPDFKSAAARAGELSWTARTTLIGRSVVFEYASSPSETTSAPVSSIQSRPVMPRSKRPSAT